MTGSTRRSVGVLAVAILAAGALAASSAGAAAPLTKKKVKKIATKVFNQKIGPATAPFLRDDLTVHSATSPTITSGVDASATVACPAGKIATGGGARLTGSYLGQGIAPPPVALQRSHPTGTPPNGWEAYAFEEEITAISWELTAYVICATP